MFVVPILTFGRLTSLLLLAAHCQTFFGKIVCLFKLSFHLVRYSINLFHLLKVYTVVPSFPMSSVLLQIFNVYPVTECTFPLPGLISCYPIAITLWILCNVYLLQKRYQC